MDEGMREMDEGMRDRTAGACRRLPQRSVAQCRVVLCVCGGPVLWGCVPCRSLGGPMPPLVVCVVLCALGAAPRRAGVPCRAVSCATPVEQRALR